MTQADRERWDAKYADKLVADQSVDGWLVAALEIAGLTGGRVLDVACGLGHNARWLSENGFEIDAVDVSPVGLAQAQAATSPQTAPIRWIEADLDDWEPPADAYDAIVVFRFLDRTSLPRLIDQGLKPGGWLVYETFSRAQLDRQDNHIRNPAFTLRVGELAELLPQLETQHEQEASLEDRTVVRYLGKHVGD